MKIILIIFAAAALPAQTSLDVTKHGADVFAKTCASGYCHAANGLSGGGAPRLSGRGFSQEYIANTVARGVSGTAMPAFGMSLPQADLVAVVAYVSVLNGITRPALPPASSAPAAPQLSAQAARGRELFSDATRGFSRCSTCHEINGIGMPVVAAFTQFPADLLGLKAVATPGVSSATVDGETMPILLVARRAQSVTFYDLTSVPPVLRTVLPAAIQTREGSSWKHSSVIASYKDEELTAILAYLRELRS